MGKEASLDVTIGLITNASHILIDARNVMAAWNLMAGKLLVGVGLKTDDMDSAVLPLAYYISLATSEDETNY